MSTKDIKHSWVFDKNKVIKDYQIHQIGICRNIKFWNTINVAKFKKKKKCIALTNQPCLARHTSDLNLRSKLYLSGFNLNRCGGNSITFDKMGIVQ